MLNDSKLWKNAQLMTYGGNKTSLFLKAKKSTWKF